MKQLLWRHKVDVGLCLLALVLAVWVMIDRGSVTTAEAEERQYQLLDAWRPDDIARIDIAQEGCVIALAQSGDQGERLWALRENGRDVPADEQAVSEVLMSLEFANYDRKLGQLDDETTGLSSPRLRYDIDMGPLAYTLKVGKPAPSPEGAYYVEVEGGSRGAVRYVVRGPVIDELTVKCGQLRTRSVSPYLSIELSSLALEGRFTLTRSDWGGRTSGAFRVEGAGVGPIRADRRIVDGWLTMLARLDAERFVPIPEAREPQATTLTLTPKDDAPVAKLHLGGRCPAPAEDPDDTTAQALVVREAPDPIAACVPADVVQQLLMDAARLADHHAVGTAEGDITEVTLSAGKTVIEMARKDSGWHMRKPYEGQAEGEAAAQLIDELVAAEGTPLRDAEGLVTIDRADRAALGLDAPRGQIVLRGLPESGVQGAPERVERITVGRPVDDRVFVHRHDDGVVLELTRATAEALLPRPTVLRPTKIYDFSLESVRGFSVDCGRPQRVSRSLGGAYTLERPDIAVGPDVSQCSQLVEGMRRLTALRWAAERAEAHHGLDEPWCTVRIDTVSFDGSDERTTTRRVILGAETAGGYFARYDDEPAVFVAPRALGEQASRWMVDRTAPVVDIAGFERIEIVRGDRKLTLEQVGGGWSGAPKDIVAKVVGAFVDLIAEGAVTLGEPDAAHGFDAPQLTITLTRRGGERVVMRVGRGDVWHGTSVFFFRKDGVDVTYAMSQTRLRPFMDAL